MIEAGRAYVSANKLFVNGIKDLSQQCKKEETISVSRRLQNWARICTFTEECFRGQRLNKSSIFAGTFLWFPTWTITAEQYKQYCPDAESSSCFKHDRCDHMQTGDVYADSLRGWKQRDLKPALWFFFEENIWTRFPVSAGVTLVGLGVKQ